ncbi:MAG TPA: PepSY domain-containing protein, partial [Longimicrobium sp.]|nr:PepSY domain-containing protein [Longimicrobium sp.]
KKADEPVAFNIDRGDGGQPQKRASLSLDRRTGAVVKWEPFPTQKPGRRMRSILRFAHTGEVLGLFGQTLAGLASAGAALLVWTGIALAWRRYRAWLARKRVSGAAPAVEARPRRAAPALDPQDATR